LASIRKEIVTSARPGGVWDAIRDIWRIATHGWYRVSTKLEPGEHIVTFGDGMVIRERSSTLTARHGG